MKLKMFRELNINILDTGCGGQAGGDWDVECWEHHQAGDDHSNNCF